MPRWLRLGVVVAVLALAVLWIGNRGTAAPSPGSVASSAPTLARTAPAAPPAAAPSIAVASAAAKAAGLPPTPAAVPATASPLPSFAPIASVPPPPPALGQAAAPIPPTVFVAQPGTSETLLWRATPGIVFQCQWSLDDVSWYGYPPTTAGGDGVARYTLTPEQTAYYRPYFPSLGTYGQVVRGVVTQQPGWTGYLVASGPFTLVAGTFVVPSIAPSATRTDVATWVGIGGYAAGDPLIQAGVWETSVPGSGQPYVYAWYELYPQMAVQRVALPVRIGDAIRVRIGQLATGRWEIDIANLTQDLHELPIDVAYAGPGSSAEWIVEAPLSDGTQLPLASFSPVTFTEVGSVGAQPTVLTLWTTDRATGAKRTTVSALSSDQRSFTVTDLGGP